MKKDKIKAKIEKLKSKIKAKTQVRLEWFEEYKVSTKPKHEKYTSDSAYENALSKWNKKCLKINNHIKASNARMYKRVNKLQAKLSGKKIEKVKKVKDIKANKWDSILRNNHLSVVNKKRFKAWFKNLGLSMSDNPFLSVLFINMWVSIVAISALTLIFNFSMIFLGMFIGEIVLCCIAPILIFCAIDKKRWECIPYILQDAHGTLYVARYNNTTHELIKRNCKQKIAKKISKDGKYIKLTKEQKREMKLANLKRKMIDKLEHRRQKFQNYKIKTKPNHESFKDSKDYATAVSKWENKCSKLDECKRKKWSRIEARYKSKINKLQNKK